MAFFFTIIALNGLAESLFSRWAGLTDTKIISFSLWFYWKLVWNTNNNLKILNHCMNYVNHDSWRQMALVNKRQPLLDQRNNQIDWTNVSLSETFGLSCKQTCHCETFIEWQQPVNQVKLFFNIFINNHKVFFFFISVHSCDIIPILLKTTDRSTSRYSLARISVLDSVRKAHYTYYWIETEFIRLQAEMITYTRNRNYCVRRSGTQT